MTSSTAHMHQSGKDIVSLITQDHEEAMMAINQAMESQDPDTRRKRGNDAIELLVRHSVAEEMFIYPYMANHIANGEEIVQHDKKEHHQLEEALAAMENVSDPLSQVYDQNMQKVKDLLAHHAKSEEEKQLPELKKAMSAEDNENLMNKFKMAKTIAPTHPHPNTNMHTKMFHVVAGPGVGLMDRLRDAIGAGH